MVCMEQARQLHVRKTVQISTHTGRGGRRPRRPAAHRRAGTLRRPLRDSACVSAAHQRSSPRRLAYGGRSLAARWPHDSGRSPQLAEGCRRVLRSQRVAQSKPPSSSQPSRLPLSLLPISSLHFLSSRSRVCIFSPPYLESAFSSSPRCTAGAHDVSARASLRRARPGGSRNGPSRAAAACLLVDGSVDWSRRSRAPRVALTCGRACRGSCEPRRGG
jgi:hypothetical protein